MPAGHLQMVYFPWILHGNVFLIKEPIRWKRAFEAFLIDHSAGDIGNKNTACAY